MPRRWVVLLVVFCVLLNGAGFIWDIFEPVPLYDEVAHLVTPFTLVAITAEILYRSGGDDEFFDTPRQRSSRARPSASPARSPGRSSRSCWTSSSQRRA